MPAKRVADSPEADRFGRFGNGDRGTCRRAEDDDHDDADEESAARPPGAPPLPPRRDRAKSLFTELFRKHNVTRAALGQGAAAARSRNSSPRF